MYFWLLVGLFEAPFLLEMVPSVQSVICKFGMYNLDARLGEQRRLDDPGVGRRLETNEPMRFLRSQ